jgi:hypothetical protein
MATVLQKCITDISVLLCVFFLSEKELNTNYIHKEIFPVYGNKCLYRKTVHNRVEKCSQRRSTIAQMMHDLVRQWLSQQSKDFYAAGFVALVNRWDKCMNVAGGSNITWFMIYVHL